MSETLSFISIVSILAVVLGLLSAAVAVWGILRAIKSSRSRESQRLRDSQTNTSLSERVRLLEEYSALGPFRAMADRRRAEQHVSPWTISRSGERSLFAERLDFFRDEKEFLAEQFAPRLFARCRSLFEKYGKHVYIYLHSGTTLYPFFRILGQEAVRAQVNGEAWVASHFTLITNNIPGLESLFSVARRDKLNRYSPLAFECKLLPGTPLPLFEALAGEDTVKGFRDLIASAKSKGNAVVVSLLSGNWIRVRRTPPACPIPLVRGASFADLMQEAVDLADEVHVVAPLGKIFQDTTADEINAVFGFWGPAREPDAVPYEEIRIEGDAANRTKLVSTSRERGRLLYEASLRLALTLQTEQMPGYDSFIKAELGHTPHLLFPYDRLPQETQAELETELPLPRMRREEFLKRLRERDRG